MSYSYEYPMPAITCDIALFHRDCNDNDFVLLIKRKNEPFAGTWCLPGGFMEIGERAAQAAVRELCEELLLCRGDFNKYIGCIKLSHLLDNPSRDPRGRIVSCLYCGTCNTKIGIFYDDEHDEVENAHWFSVWSLPPVGFDHNEAILNSYRNWVKYDA